MLREAGEDDCEVVPSEGVCWVPGCERRLLWSRLVKGVQAYRPRVSSSSEPEQEVGDEPVDGGTAVDGGPLVWRVDDSDDDDDEDGESDGDGSEGVSDLETRENGGAGWSSGAVSRDSVSANEEEEEEEADSDDSFWRLSGGSPGCSQARRIGSSGRTRGTGPIPSCGGNSEMGFRTSSLRTDRRPEVDKSCRGGHTSPVDTTSDLYDSDDGGSGDQERETVHSPLMIPLAERLRQRRERDI